MWRVRVLRVLWFSKLWCGVVRGLCALLLWCGVCGCVDGVVCALCCVVVVFVTA